MKKAGEADGEGDVGEVVRGGWVRSGRQGDGEGGVTLYWVCSALLESVCMCTCMLVCALLQVNVDAICNMIDILTSLDV